MIYNIGVKQRKDKALDGKYALLKRVVKIDLEMLNLDYFIE